MVETTIRLRAGAVIELTDGDEEMRLKVLSFAARSVTTYLAPDEIHQLVVALSGDDHPVAPPSSRDEEVRERLVAVARQAEQAIDGHMKFLLVSGLAEEGGGLPLYESSKGLAEARASIAALNAVDWTIPEQKEREES
jgi:hypothetical protein